ncbi:MAG: hypothetical protein V9H26_05755 [Verrucomicrobiota bacterium]
MPFKIAYESYVKDNWDIFVMRADGEQPVNLTDTPKDHEHYPQVSPDGTKICFSVDQGKGRDAVRSLYVMDSDGKTPEKARGECPRAILESGWPKYWLPAAGISQVQRD